MNRDRNVDDIVTKWVDEGPDAAPERFVWAALDVVERTPQRGRGRIALENMPMFAKLALPIVGAAAVLAIAVLAYQQLGGTGTGNGPSASPEPTASPSASAAAASPCRSEVVTVPAPRTLDVVWCIPRGLDQVVVAFGFDGPAEWIGEGVYTGGESLYLRPTNGRAIAFFLNGPDTADAWLAEITANEAFDVSEPQPVTLDGADGFVIDVRLADGTSDAPPLIESSDVPWNLTEDTAARVWIIDAEPEALAIVTGADEAAFTEWADAVGEGVSSLRWTSP